MTMPFSVEHIDHVVLRVKDLDKSVAFYQTILGCAVVRVREDLGMVHLRAGTAMIDLVSVDGALGRKGGAAPGRSGQNVDHVCLRIEPFVESDIISHLAGHGLAPSGELQVNFGAEGEGPSLYISDPDGNGIELKGPADA